MSTIFAQSDLDAAKRRAIDRYFFTQLEKQLASATTIPLEIRLSGARVIFTVFGGKAHREQYKKNWVLPLGIIELLIAAEVPPAMLIHFLEEDLLLIPGIGEEEEEQILIARAPFLPVFTGS